MSVTHTPKAGALLTGTEYEAADSHIVTGEVPVGAIVMWSGSIASIPTPEWVLCDGTQNAPGPDLRDKFVVGATQDQGGLAKTNIEGSLKVSATQTGASVADHTNLTHDGSVASHPDLTHVALSHPALTVVHPDHSVASASHTHASGADVSVPSGSFASSNAVSYPSHSHASAANASAPSGSYASTANVSIGNITVASGADISIASQAIASGVDISIASLTGSNPSGTVTIASQGGVNSYASGSNRSGVVSVTSKSGSIASQTHTHAAATASRPSLAVAAATGSRPALTFGSVANASMPSQQVASTNAVSVPSSTAPSGADASRPSGTIASTAGASRPSLTGSGAAVTVTHADHSLASLSHQAIGTHANLSHAFTPPAGHGTAGTVTHSTVAIVPAYFALAFIQRMS